MMKDEPSRMNEPDPDQILRSLDIALAQARAKNSHRETNRTTFRIMSILVVLIGLMAALAVMYYMASELSERQPRPKATPAADGAK